VPVAELSQPGRRPGGRTPHDRQSPEVPVHLPTPAVAVTVVYAAALAVAVASAATGSAREALAGLVVLTALVARWAVRRSRRAAPATAAALATVDAALPAALPEPAPAVRAA
jgi:hypothetical protein